MAERTLTRRALVGAAGAALGAMGIPITAEAGFPAADPDADLPALLGRFAAAQAAWEATDAPLTEAIGRARDAYPRRPDALRPVFGDLVNGVGFARSDTGREAGPDGRTRGFYTLADVEGLRAAGPITVPGGWDDDGRPQPDRPSPAGEARRCEIMASSDRWEAERREVEDRVGLTAASKAEEAAGKAYYAADEALEAYQPRTVAGLVLKAAWVVERLSTSEGARASDLGEVFARQVAAFGGVST